MTHQLLPLELQAQLKAKQPAMTVPSYAAAQSVVTAIKMYSAANPTEKDINGLLYWRCALADLVELIKNPIVTPKLAGSICRSFQLAMKRENDGFKVGWSKEQLDILTANIK
jgi:hypothetical protein